jgi:hypothetical protein
MLHFDNLTETSKLINYWDRFTINSKNAFQQAAREGDSFKVLVLLGMSLHAVQDFYTHSNWVETHPPSDRASYNTVTWFDTNKRNGVHTGKYPNSEPIKVNVDHGDYDQGLNHDSQSRPNFDRAYVFAHAGSRQWINQVRLWVEEVNPQVWSAAKNLDLGFLERTQLKLALNSAYRVSLWCNLKGKNGLWKGQGSGDTAQFAKAEGLWLAYPRDRFTRPFGRSLKTSDNIRQLLAPDLVFLDLSNPPGGQDLSVDAPPTVPVPTIKSIPMNKKVVLVQTTEVKELPPVGWIKRKIDSNGNADFYAKVIIDGMTFMENTYQDKFSVSNPWKVIKFVDENKGNVDIRYEVWDEDGLNDDHVDVFNGRGQDQVMTYSTQTGELNGTIRGIFNTAENTWVGEGDGSNRASVRVYIKTQALSSFAGL